MVSRDELLKHLYVAQFNAPNTSIGITERVLLDGAIKQINKGADRMTIIMWLQTQQGHLGPDVRDAATHVYELIKNGDI